MKYETAFRNSFSGMQVFTKKDAARFLGNLDASDNYVRLFLHNMTRKKELFRISRGYYSFSNNEALTGFAFRPFYYGLWYALTIRGLWNQQANPVIMTTTKTEPGTRNVLGHKVLVKRIADKAFFGFEYVLYSGVFVPVSTVEKTLMDFMYYKIGLDTETKLGLIKTVDQRLLNEYAQRLGRPKATDLLALLL